MCAAPRAGRCLVTVIRDRGVVSGILTADRKRPKFDHLRSSVCRRLAVRNRWPRAVARAPSSLTSRGPRYFLTGKKRVTVVPQTGQTPLAISRPFSNSTILASLIARFSRHLTQ